MSERYVYIYRASKTAMQSGRALTDHWLAEFPNSDSQRSQASSQASSEGWRYLPDAVMSWHGGGDTSGQVRLSFADLDGALRWADSQGLTPIVRPQQVRKWERQDTNRKDANLKDTNRKATNRKVANQKTTNRVINKNTDKEKISKRPYGKSYASNFAHDRKVPWTH